MGGMKYWLGVAAMGLLIGAGAALAPMIGGSREPPPAAPDQAQAAAMEKMQELRYLGARHLAEGRLPEAVGALLQLCDLNHYDLYSYQRLGAALSEMGREKFDAALAERIRGKWIAPREAMTRAAAYYHAAMVDEASETLEGFLAAHPDDLPALYYRGAIARQRGDMGAAEATLKTVVEREPTYYYAYLELQKIYNASGRAAEADQMATLALKHSPASSGKGVCCGMSKKEESKAG